MDPRSDTKAVLLVSSDGMIPPRYDLSRLTLGGERHPIHGRVGLGALGDLQDAITRSIEDGYTDAIIDCSAVRRLSSGLMAFLVELLGLFRTAGGDLVVTGLSCRGFAALEATGLDRVMVTEDSVESALARFNRAG